MVWLVPSMSSPNPYPFPNFMFWLLCGVLGKGLLTSPPAPEQQIHSGDPLPAKEPTP